MNPNRLSCEASAKMERVYYEGASTIREGMPLCFHYDTTDNIDGWSDSSGAVGTTTAEGYQNEGKYKRVEDPTETNRMWLAGYVAGNSQSGKIGPRWLDIYVPNGAIVPVWTTANCTGGLTVLGLSDGVTALVKSTGDDDPLACAVAEETVNRSSVNGLVLAKIFPTGQVIAGLGGYFLPTTYANGRCYGFTVCGDYFFGGVAGAQEYLVHFQGSKSVASTGDCYGGILKISGTNEAANAATYTFRGINANVTNDEDGVVGELGHNISIILKQGSTTTTARGLCVDVQDLAETAKTEFGGLDVALNREGLAATLEYGIQVRTRGTINTAMSYPLYFKKGATDYGFSALFGVDAIGTIGMTTASTVTVSHKLLFKVGAVSYYIPCGTTTT